MVATALPTVSSAPSSVLSELTKATDSTFELLYFDLHGLADGVRMTLAASGATWSHLAVEEWPTFKKDMPFQVLPIVYEKTASGETLQLAESAAIEKYLAQKYGFVGKDAWEEQVHSQVVSSIEAGTISFNYKFLFQDADKKATEHAKWMATNWVKFVEVHSALLAKNGSNGHYFGNRITLADLKTLVLIERLLAFIPKGNPVPEIGAEFTKLRQTLLADEKIRNWVESENYKELTTKTIARLGL